MQATTALTLYMLLFCACAQNPLPIYFEDETIIAEPYGSSSPVSNYAAYPNILFLNFEGVTIASGEITNSIENISHICSATVPPFDHTIFGNSRSDVIEELKEKVAKLFADFNLQIVTSRPANEPYTMVVIGGAPELCNRQNGIAGLSPLDCNNVNLNDICFVFSEPITSLELLAIVIAHETAHTYGLVHTMEPCDVMSNFICPTGAKQFLNKTEDVTPDYENQCKKQKTINTWQELSIVLGLSNTYLDSGIYEPDSKNSDINHSDSGKTEINSVGCHVILPVFSDLFQIAYFLVIFLLVRKLRLEFQKWVF